MRLVTILFILGFASAGAIFGALNGESVIYDFYFFTFATPKGAMLIAAVLFGWVLGGALVYLGLVLRLRSQLRAQAKSFAAMESGASLPSPELDR